MSAKHESVSSQEGCPLAVAGLLSLRVRAFPTFPPLPVLPVLAVLAASAPQPQPGLGQPGRRPLLEAFPPEPPVACAPQPARLSDSTGLLSVAVYETSRNLPLVFRCWLV